MKKLKHRPQSFKQAAMLVNAGLYEFGEALAELIDETKRMNSVALAGALAEEPPLLKKHNVDYGDWQDSYLAAAAEHIARGASVEIPKWTDGRERFLARAWFDNHGLKSLNAMMIAESPLAFRRRFIFTEARPLRRA
jgi:hypothetical protein